MIRQSEGGAYECSFYSSVTAPRIELLLAPNSVLLLEKSKTNHNWSIHRVKVGRDYISSALVNEVTPWPRKDSIRISEGSPLSRGSVVAWTHRRARLYLRNREPRDCSPCVKPARTNYCLTGTDRFTYSLTATSDVVEPGYEALRGTGHLFSDS